MNYPRLILKTKTPKDGIDIQEERLVNVDIFHPFSNRGSGEFEDKGFRLPGGYDWVIGEDSEGVVCLIPLKKTD